MYSPFSFVYVLANTFDDSPWVVLFSWYSLATSYACCPFSPVLAVSESYWPFFIGTLSNSTNTFAITFSLLYIPSPTLSYILFPLIFIGVLSFGLSSYTIPDNSVCVPFDNLNVGAIVVSFSNVSVTNVLSVSICTFSFLEAEFLSILAYAVICCVYVEYLLTSAIISNLIPTGLFNILAIVSAYTLNVTSSTSFFPADIFLSSSFSKLITASFKFSVPPYTVLATISCSETSCVVPEFSYPYDIKFNSLS